MHTMCPPSYSIQATISNDGAKILQMLDIIHPAAKTLVDIARAQVGMRKSGAWRAVLFTRGCALIEGRVFFRSPACYTVMQDAEVGDGTTTVTLLAAELLRLAKPFIEDGVHPQIIVKVRACLSILCARTLLNIFFFSRIQLTRWLATAHTQLCTQGYRKAAQLALEKIHSVAVSFGESPGARRTLLEKCAKTSLNSKLIARYQDFFAPMIVDAIECLGETLDLSLVGVKKVRAVAVALLWW